MNVSINYRFGSDAAEDAQRRAAALIEAIRAVFENFFEAGVTEITIAPAGSRWSTDQPGAAN